MIRNNFSIKTWLLLGGAAQATLMLLPIQKYIAAAPVFTFLLWSLLDTFLQVYGFKPNPYMAGVIVGKHSAVPPSAFSSAASSGPITAPKLTAATSLSSNPISHDEPADDQPASEGIVVLHLMARSNHPTGMAAHGFQKTGKLISIMNQDLEKNAVEYGWLGGNNYFASSDRADSTEFFIVHYFKSYEGLSKFAHGESHRKGWDWYNAWSKENKYLGFAHEVFDVPKGKWETIYLNSAPTGLGTTFWPVKEESEREKGKIVWQSPIVDASRSKLRSAGGRLGMDDGSTNEKYGAEPYSDAKIIS